MVHYENAKSHVKGNCRSEQCLCLDLRVLGAVGHICFIAAESRLTRTYKSIYRSESYST